MKIAMQALSSVAVEELVLSQVKRQVDDSEGDGKPFLPLWADRVGFRVGPRGGMSMVNDPLLKKVRSNPTRLARYLKQLKRVTGRTKRIARQIIRALRSVRHGSKVRTRRGGTRKKAAPKPGKVFYSYRRGGKPLKDTGQGYGAIHTRSHGSWPSVAVVVRAPLYMIYQHQGFTTKGPNFVPLSLLAKRTHQAGADPRAEGLKRGIDYWIFRRGVTVPPRPFAKLGPKYLRRFARSLYLSMKAASINA